MTEYRLKGTGLYDLEVVGESHYQDNLHKLCGRRKEEGEQRYEIASLIPETDNKYDPNAVRVEIRKRKVGHLSRRDAAYFREIVYPECQLTPQDVLVLNAVIVGGWSRGKDQGHYGVRLESPLSISETIQKAKENPPKPLPKLPLSCLIIVAVGLVLFCTIIIIVSFS